MAQRPMDHEAYSGMDEPMYQNGQAFNSIDSNFVFSGDQYNNDAAWSLNPSTLHAPQALSRGQSHSPVWPTQPTQHLQQQQLHARPLSTGPQPDSARHSPYQSAPFAVPPFQAHSNYQFQQQYDPSLLGANHGINRAYPNYGSQMPESHTIAPQSLQHDPPQDSYRSFANQEPMQTLSVSAKPVDQNALVAAVPASENAGMFNVIDFDKLVRATNSERMSNFATIGRQAQEWAITRAALPAYAPRKSRNELKAAAGNDPSLLAKIGKSRKHRSKSRTLDRKALNGRTGVKAEVSEESSDDYTDSGSESEEESPLPTKRPELPREAIEYDTIEAVWRSKRRAVDANDVRKGLVAFWEVVKVLRDRWKTDIAAVTEAEQKAAKGELPFLKQRVKDQRDLVEIAFKTALKHGNRTILETLSENTSLLFLCYQFLLDRYKAEDINGNLARAILELMSSFNSLTEEKLDKTNVSKVLPRIIKAGDAKTQFWAKQIAAKAAAGKSAVKDEQKSVVAVKTEATAGVKRPGGVLTNPSTVKKPATGVVKTAAVKAEPQPAMKKRALGEDASKPVAKKVATSTGTEAKADAAAKTKPVSKLTNSLFAGLQSAGKKPGTSVKAGGAPAAKEATKPAVTPAAAPARPAFSLADTMKSIAKAKEDKPAVKEEKEVVQETAEQKARRLRREKRGPLRVHWKSGEDLVAIKLFTHDPEEDEGHDSSQTRDVADLKGEGRMFKQQHNSMMDMDDDDDEATPAKNIKLVDWYQPELTDYSGIDKDDRERNYSRYAGGELQPVSPESAAREKYEAETLLVFYASREDIPSTPREPAQPISGDAPASITSFGQPDQKIANRARQVHTLQKSISSGINNAPVQAPIDFDKLRNALSMTAPPQPVAPAPDISSILAALSAGTKPAAPPMFTAPNQAWPGMLPIPPPQPPSNAGQPDIGAILAQLNGGQQPIAPVQPPAMPNFGAAAMDPGFLAFVAQQQAAAQAQHSSNGIYENPERKRWRDGEH